MVYTDSNSQTALMSLLPKEDIGMEVHPETTQYIYIVKGVGEATVGKKHYALGPGVMVPIHPGARHNIINASKTQRLQLFTIYTPPEHPPYTFQKTKPLDD